MKGFTHNLFKDLFSEHAPRDLRILIFFDTDRLLLYLQIKDLRERFHNPNSRYCLIITIFVVLENNGFYVKKFIVTTFSDIFPDKLLYDSKLNFDALLLGQDRLLVS